MVNRRSRRRRRTRQRKQRNGRRTRRRRPRRRRRGGRIIKLEDDEWKRKDAGAILGKYTNDMARNKEPGYLGQNLHHLFRHRQWKRQRGLPVMNAQRDMRRFAGNRMRKLTTRPGKGSRRAQRGERFKAARAATRRRARQSGRVGQSHRGLQSRR